MQIYIPEPLLNNSENLERVYEILEEVPSSDLVIPGVPTMDDARQRIRELGEDRIADFIMA